MPQLIVALQTEKLAEALAHLARQAQDLTPAMRKISEALAYQTDENFAAEGRPSWEPSERAKNAGGKTLQDSGQLASSIETHYSRSHAAIGTNKVYAAIHQFGGKTKAHRIAPQSKKALAFGGIVVRGVNHPGSDIPARPFLPMDAEGRLQPEAEAEVLETVLRHLQNAASR